MDVVIQASSQSLKTYRLCACTPVTVNVMCKYVKHKKQREQNMDGSLVRSVEGYCRENPSFLIDTFKFAYLESGMQPLNSALVRLGLSFSPSPGGFLTECLNILPICFSPSSPPATFHQGSCADTET